MANGLPGTTAGRPAASGRELTRLLESGTVNSRFSAGAVHLMHLILQDEPAHCQAEP